MGRKIEIKKIGEASKRQVTYAKRRKNLIKKAEEVSVICDVDVAFLTFSPAGRVTQFSTTDGIEEMVDRYVNVPTEKRLRHIKDIQGKMQKLHELDYIKTDEAKIHYLNDQIKNLEMLMKRKNIEVQLAEANISNYEPMWENASLHRLSWVEGNLQKSIEKLQEKKKSLPADPPTEVQKLSFDQKGKSVMHEVPFADNFSGAGHVHSAGASSSRNLQSQPDLWAPGKYGPFQVPQNIFTTVLEKQKQVKPVSEAPPANVDNNESSVNVQMEASNANDIHQVGPAGGVAQGAQNVQIPISYANATNQFGNGGVDLGARNVQMLTSHSNAINQFGAGGVAQGAQNVQMPISHSNAINQFGTGGVAQGAQNVQMPNPYSNPINHFGNGVAQNVQMPTPYSNAINQFGTGGVAQGMQNVQMPNPNSNANNHFGTGGVAQGVQNVQMPTPYYNAINQFGIGGVAQGAQNVQIPTSYSNAINQFGIGGVAQGAQNVQMSTPYYNAINQFGIGGVAQGAQNVQIPTPYYNAINQFGIGGVAQGAQNVQNAINQFGIGSVAQGAQNVQIPTSYSNAINQFGIGGFAQGSQNAQMPTSYSNAINQFGIGGLAQGAQNVQLPTSYSNAINQFGTGGAAQGAQNVQMPKSYSNAVNQFGTGGVAQGAQDWQCSYAPVKDHQFWSQAPSPWQQQGNSNPSFGSFACESSRMTQNNLPAFQRGFNHSLNSVSTNFTKAGDSWMMDFTEAEASNDWVMDFQETISNQQTILLNNKASTEGNHNNINQDGYGNGNGDDNSNNMNYGTKDSMDKATDSFQVPSNGNSNDFSNVFPSQDFFEEYASGSDQEIQQSDIWEEAYQFFQCEQANNFIQDMFDP